MGTRPAAGKLKSLKQEIREVNMIVAGWEDVTEDLKGKGLTSAGMFYFIKAEQRYQKFNHPHMPSQ